MLAPGGPASRPGWCDSSQAVTAGRSRPGGTSDMCAMMSRMPRTRVLTPLRWSDMDAYGHVNNVQFLRLLEDARVIAFAAAGTDEGGSVVDTGLLVARSEIEYLEPLVYRTAPVLRPRRDGAGGLRQGPAPAETDDPGGAGAAGRLARRAGAVASPPDAAG